VSILPGGPALIRPASFDPVGAVYLAQDRRPAALRPVALTELSALQRALLVIDGTVTTFIEAWALEPVRVDLLAQGPAAPALVDHWLGLLPGETPVSRSVVLRGAHSGRLFARAESRILPWRLPEAAQRELLAGQAGLGQILVAHGLESRREALWFGQEEHTPADESGENAEKFLSRTYRICVAGRPAMLITERFPWQAFPAD
jgi:chorismate-pyruvate lyase